MNKYFYYVEYFLVPAKAGNKSIYRMVAQSPTQLGPEEMKDHIRKDLKIDREGISIYKIEVIPEERFNEVFLANRTVGEA